MPTKADFGDQLASKTEAYLERLDDCVSLLPVVLEEYASDGQYRDTVERIEAFESDGDELIRDVTAFITNAGPEDIGLLNTRINYNESALIELYKNVDVVANLTERIAQELVMMQPSADTECYEGLQEMADLIVSMLTTLEDVVERFIYSLSNADVSDSLAEEIQSIRKGESRCDEIRNDVIATAFRDDTIDEPLMYREFAILIDDVANKMEDITDQIVIIASDEPDIVTEADPNGE